jgi:hypothetical protein
MATAAPTPIGQARISSPGVVKAKEEQDRSAQQQTEVSSPFETPVQFVISELPPNARPARLLFGAVKQPTWRLRKPIPLDVSTEDTHVVVTWADIDEFGYGSTMGAAADDFGRALGELYERLQESEQLGPDLLRVKQILSQYIEIRSR